MSNAAVIRSIRWVRAGLIISKRQDAYALVTISSNTLGQRAARSSCNDYVHIKRNFHWRSAPWFMVSYFYSSINYTAYHTGNTVPYQRAFLRSSASTVSGGKSLCVPRLTRFDRPRKMRDFEIFICHTRRAPHINDATRSHCCQYSFVT